MLSESDILFAIYIAIPAYVANAFPTLFKGGPPIDLGRRFMDGERILGDNKTLRGLAFGLLSGLSATVAEALFFGQELLLLGGLVSVGALSLKHLGAFIKRRMKFQPGAPFPLLDQLDFVLGALLLSYPVHHVSLGTVLVIVISTPPIHLLANSIAYRLGVKKNWW